VVVGVEVVPGVQDSETLLMGPGTGSEETGVPAATVKFRVCPVVSVTVTTH
jgi:hypothetical protein